MKPRRVKVQLSEKQQLVLGFLLVILVAVSMLYCLGIASVAFRQAWEENPGLLNDATALDEAGEPLLDEPVLTPDAGPAPN